MGNEASYTINPIYTGGYSSLKSNYEKGTSYDNKIKAGTIGLTTDPRTMNLVGDVSTKLSSGVKYIDVTAVTPEYFDNISKQQTEEVRRLAKLTGIDVDVHGPVINPAGFTQQGWNEVERELTEKKIVNTLRRSHELNPKGNIHVNFHSSEGLPGSQWLPPSKRNEKDGNYKRLIVVNRETGRMAPLDTEIKYYPQMVEPKEGVKEKESGYLPQELQEIPLEKGKIYTPKKRIDVLNESEWDNQLNQVFFNQERANEILGKNLVQIQYIMPEIQKIAQANGGKIPLDVLSPEQRSAYNNYTSAKNYLQDIHQQANGLFSKAYEFGDQKQKDALKKLSEDFKKQLPEQSDPWREAQAMQNLINELKSSRFTPKMYVPVEEFAIEKGGETYGNATFEAYKEFGKTAPTLVIENPPAGQALATGEDIKKIVEKSREQFVKKAVEEGISKKTAEKEAEKLIGATWDVGHANMLRKFGYSEKETIEEAAKVKGVLKHIHLSDNFGMEHTELPMGMGNVPFKEIMAKFGEKGYNAKKLIEAGQWWAQFKGPPLKETLEGLGSPIYGMKMAGAGGQYWDQSPGFYQSYSEGMQGMWLPQINYETFGGGFSRLPPELGGARPGAAGSRMSGRGME